MNDVSLVGGMLADERGAGTNDEDCRTHQSKDAEEDESAASENSRFSIRRMHVGSNGSVTSFSKVWRRLYKSSDGNHRDHGHHGPDQVKRNYTSGTSNEDGGSDDVSLRERGENDLFALEVGLML